MSDEELFHAATLSSGGRFPRDRLSPTDFDSTYGYIQQAANNLIASARQHVPGLPPIHFDFILDGRFNAYAFKADGRHFIGFNTGTRYLLDLVFFRMLADGRLFSEIGDPAAERSDLPPIIGYSVQAERMYRAGILPVRPTCDKRWSYACALIRNATTFLIGHEIAHITRGHVGYIESVGGHGYIPEVGWTDVGAGGAVERQALEMDADGRSAQAAMASAALTHARLDHDRSHFMATRMSVDHLLFDWAFAMNTVFRLFGDIRFDPATASASSYPPEPLRRLMASNTAIQYVITCWNPGLRESAFKAFKMAALYTELAFMTMLGQESGSRGLAAFTREGVEHHVRLLQLWQGTVSGRLAPFAFERDPAGLGAFSEGGDNSTIQELVSADL